MEVLKTAAKTRQVPSSEILSAFAEIKKNAPDEIDLSTLGGNESPGRTWMLVFTSKGKSSDKGNYFPITAVQRFDAAGRRIENGVYFGALGNLSFEGRLSWKKKILAFVFERIRIKAGPFGPFEINLGQTDPNREPSNKDPFFIWFYVDEEIAVAQGKSGGTAFWCRCARIV